MSGETSSRVYRELCGPEGVVLQQNNFLQQVIQEVHPDPFVRETISEHHDNIGQIIQEVYRLREEMAKVKLTLRQGLILIDETCSKHATVLEGLQSFAGSQVGTNQRVQEMLQSVSGLLSVVQQRTLELQKDTSLDWRIQSIKDDLLKLQKTTQVGSLKESQDQTLGIWSDRYKISSKIPYGTRCKSLQLKCDTSKKIPPCRERC